MGQDGLRAIELDEDPSLRKKIQKILSDIIVEASRLHGELVDLSKANARIVERSKN